MAGRRRTSVAVGVVALAALAGATGCRSTSAPASTPTPVASIPSHDVGSTPAPAPPAGVASVAMIGDSITVGSLEELRAAFSAIGIGEVVIDAQSSRRIAEVDHVPSGVDAVAEVLAAGEPPDLWVIALGTNDLGPDATARSRQAIGRLLTSIPAGTPVVWIDTYSSGQEEASASFNATLRQLLTERGMAAVVDWASTARRPGILGDGTHPTERGEVEFARSVADGVRRWMP